MAERVLELSTGIDRPTIAIDGTSYEMRTPDEFSWEGNQRLRSKGVKFQKLGERFDKGEDFSEEDISEMARSCDELIDTIMVDLPAEVKEKLTPSMQLKIIEAFTTLSIRETKKEANEPAAKTIPASPSPDYSGSMAETPGDG